MSHVLLVWADLSLFEHRSHQHDPIESHQNLVALPNDWIYGVHQRSGLLFLVKCYVLRYLFDVQVKI